jgi:ParB family chromosome partitioning protein
VIPVFEAVERRGLSVRETERMCGGAEKRKAAGKARRVDVHMKSLEEELSRRGGTRVRLRGTSAKGRVEISWFSAGELDRLVKALFGGR